MATACTRLTAPNTARQDRRLPPCSCLAAGPYALAVGRQTRRQPGHVRPLTGGGAAVGPHPFADAPAAVRHYRWTAPTPCPVRRPPSGATTPPAARRRGEGVVDGRLELPRRRPRRRPRTKRGLDRLCAEIGRDPASITRFIVLPVPYNRPDVTWDAVEAAVDAGWRHVVPADRPVPGQRPARAFRRRARLIGPAPQVAALRRAAPPPCPSGGAAAR